MYAKLAAERRATPWVPIYGAKPAPLAPALVSSNADLMATLAKEHELKEKAMAAATAAGYQGFCKNYLFGKKCRAGPRCPYLHTKGA